MMLSVLIVVVSACVAALAQAPPQPDEEENGTKSVVLKELPHPWVLGELSRPLVKGELPRPWLLRELPRPLVGGTLLPRVWPAREVPHPSDEEESPRSWPLKEVPRPLVEGKEPQPWFLRDLPQRYYPLRYHPYQQYRALPEDGKGVAIHPDGATSYVIPQVHGVGKRSARPAPQADANPNFAYRYLSGNSNYIPYSRYRYYNHPLHSFVYHHQLHRRSPGPQNIKGHPSKHLNYHVNPHGSHHGYRYMW
ncbi:uncharacterized protein [Panulirus ornatus]|uniref:uncharacterized protein n=1 Tax=Panulirus ornatus TaxID=150431 RepID=UPI003A8943F0